MGTSEVEERLEDCVDERISFGRKFISDARPKRSAFRFLYASLASDEHLFVRSYQNYKLSL